MALATARWSEVAPAKINLALHVRGRLPDGRHALETLFAFCTDGDRVSAEPLEDLDLQVVGPMAGDLGPGVGDNLVLQAAEALMALRRERVPGFLDGGARLTLEKNLPVASGLGGGSADAAAALRLLTAMWRLDPAWASEVAPKLGADVPACLLSMTARGEGAGDVLRLIDDPSIAGTPVLLVNPMVPLSTRAVFERWDGEDRGPLGADWRSGRNDLQAAAMEIVPQIADVLAWLNAQDEVTLARMSGSGASCFGLFVSEEARDRAAETCPSGWWHLASTLR